MCILRQAVVHGLCHADLFDERILATNLWLLSLAYERAFTNLESLDKTPLIKLPPLFTPGGEQIPEELMEMAESIRPSMRTFLKNLILKEKNDILKFLAFDKSTEELENPMMAFAVTAPFLRLIIRAGKSAYN